MQHADPLPPYESTPVFFPDFADASQPLLQLRACRPNGLLPCPAAPGWSLDVNDLLILHPDAHRGDRAYTEWKLITCRVCGKTYDGKNGRSVARRHLQDKHGMPLAAQSRRSRWDLLRMTTDEHQHQPGVKRKRLSSSRQQAKLERIYAGFLERFGPRGLFTPFGVSLIAPKFRDEARHNSSNDKPDDKDYLDGSYGSVIIPEEILRGVAAMRDDWDEDEDDPTHRSSYSSSSSLPTQPLPREGGAPRPSLNPTTQPIPTPTAASSTTIPIHTNSFYATDKPSFPPPLAQSQPAAASSSSRKEPEVKRARIDSRENWEEAEKRVKAEGLLASRSNL
ncbi:hypothetical protein CNBG_1311 [Cryptococcus deuterogattii R265]|uniref:BED-type domain-containing protein n=1 Tax=Cryptococcus deuterogattii (strain R265) TaxID=294750 RepID=A0A095EDE4_CRYD2|nr:hypothetical protein CNBG_1311 [Cryptococcus deuterogattii R265]KIR72802.1 hypothetical protein I310_03404 [Cryptococcus deuterogattii CA1014]